MDNRMDRISRGLAGTSSRRQALKMLGGGLVGGALAGVGLSAANNAAAQPERANPLTGIPVEGVVQEAGGVFSGWVTITNLSDAGDGTLLADGVVGGAIDGVAIADDTFVGAPLTMSQFSSTASTQGRRAFAQQGGGSCQILYLTLGPLFLDVLGLVIELPNELVIDVRAERGPGNLLGNLLCAVAGLLDGGGGALQGLLNRINQLLGGL